MDEDKVIKRIIKIEEDVKEIKETIVTKTDFETMMGSLDAVVKITKKISDEQTVQGDWLKRLQKNDEKQDSDIGRIKSRLKMA